MAKRQASESKASKNDGPLAVEEVSSVVDGEETLDKRECSMREVSKSNPSKNDGPLAFEEASAVVDGEETFYIVEGDLLLDTDEYDLWVAQQRVKTAVYELITNTSLAEALITPGGSGTAALTGITSAGRIIRWAPGVVLTYCVLARTFPRQEQYEEVVENMIQATRDWENTCGVQFQYVDSADGSTLTRPPEVLFPVRYINANGAFIATAFFPNDVASRRRVLIDPSYFTTAFDHVGVLRHELGHVLGWRHEAIRSGAPAECPDESNQDTFDITPYDPQSVMHYFCGGVGSRSLAITEVDRAGSQIVYGPPLKDFELILPD